MKKYEVKKARRQALLQALAAHRAACEALDAATLAAASDPCYDPCYVARHAAREVFYTTRCAAWLASLPVRRSEWRRGAPPRALFSDD